MAQADQPEPIQESIWEDQLILRVPDHVAEKIRSAKSFDSFDLIFHTERTGVVKIENKSFNFTLYDLPTLIESHKTSDYVSFYKSNDIGQMIVVSDLDDPEGENQPDSFLRPSGITTPTHNILKTRYGRRSTSDLNFQEVEHEINRLSKEKYEEIEEVDPRDVAGLQDVTVVKYQRDARPSHLPPSRRATYYARSTPAFSSSPTPYQRAAVANYHNPVLSNSRSLYSLLSPVTPISPSSPEGGASSSVTAPKGKLPTLANRRELSPTRIHLARSNLALQLDSTIGHNDEEYDSKDDDEDDDDNDDDDDDDNDEILDVEGDQSQRVAHGLKMEDDELDAPHPFQQQNFSQSISVSDSKKRSVLAVTDNAIPLDPQSIEAPNKDELLRAPEYRANAEKRAQLESCNAAIDQQISSLVAEISAEESRLSSTPNPQIKNRLLCKITEKRADLEAKIQQQQALRKELSSLDL